MQMRQMEPQKKTYRTALITLLVIILIVVINVYGVLGRSVQPINKANREYSALVVNAKKLTKVEHFYWSSRDQTYYTFIGKNQRHQETGVIVEKQSKKMVTIAMKDGLSYDAVKQLIVNKYAPKKITNIGMGIYKKVPVWEVKFIDQDDNLNFITVQFENGKIVRTINNL